MNKLTSILLVDDDETTNYINSQTITRADLTDELIIARNGLEALHILQRRYQGSQTKEAVAMPRLILLDLNMPVMDSFTFLEELQNHEWYKNHEVLVAVLTSSLNPTDLERVQALGINEFLNKPLSKEVLQKLILGIAN